MDKETFGVRAAVLQVTHCSHQQAGLCGSSPVCMHKYLHAAVLSHGGTKVTPG